VRRPGRGPLRGDGVMLAAVLALAGFALGGCGNSRTPVPSSVAPAAPNGFRILTYAVRGISLSAPRNWTVSAGRGSLIGTVTSGAAVVALWRFPRSAPPPSGRRSLQRLKLELVSEARTRDPNLRLVGTASSVVGGAPSVQLDALERVGGEPHRVRSTHVFVPHAELVLDEYAPPGLFRSVDESVFSPVKRSLRPLPEAS
jgi:hypothetical protein